MLHARDDYNRIQDPENKIGENEPVMLFRAQDKYFIRILAYYRNLIESNGGDSKIAEAVSTHIRLARDWPTKEPDM